MHRTGLILVMLIAGCSNGGKTSHADERIACADFYNASQKRAGSEAKAVDAWVKSGRIVIELASQDGDQVVINHCIVNPETRQLRLASPYDISWERPVPKSPAP